MIAGAVEESSLAAPVSAECQIPSGDGIPISEQHENVVERPVIQDLTAAVTLRIVLVAVAIGDVTNICSVQRL
eukprot:1975813-Rhodomonas_salina.1